jgi:hypothetical protein
MVFPSLCQSGFDWILRDIPLMHRKILFIPNSMIGKSRDPNVPVPAQLSLRTKRKSALYALHRPLQILLGRNQHMKMVRHQNEAMNQKPFRPVSIKRLDKKLRPSCVPEKWSPLSRVGGHEVGLTVVCRNLSRRPFSPLTARLKPRPFKTFLTLETASLGWISLSAH